MIKKRVLVSRYAQAFIKYAKEGSGVDKAVNDVKSVRDIMRENDDFRKYLENPEVPFVDQCHIIDQVLADGFCDEIKHFLRLLIQRQRISLFWDISEYIRLTYCNEGAEEALLKTTLPLDLDLIQKIKDTFEKRLQRKLKFYIELDSTLLGGVQVIVGNKIFDGSVKWQLANLKERLIAARMN